MARLTPNQPVGNVPAPVARMFRLVKSLPDDFMAWFSLGHDDTNHPHFFLVWRERYCFLLHVAPTSQQLAETALQADFLTYNEETLTADSLGASENAVLEAFAAKVHPELGLPRDAAVPVKKLVVFPNVKRGTIDQIILQRSEDNDTAYLGCYQLGEAQFTNYLLEIAVAALPAYSLSVFRKHFNPECTIPRTFSPLAPPERNEQASLTELLIDFDQESVAKADLALSSEGETLVNDLQTRLVTGVAGSGKSLVLIIRAMLMARLHEGSRLLVLTHNRPLSNELRQRFQQICGHWPHFEWLTYFGWLRQCLAEEDWPESILSGKALEQMAREILQMHPKLQDFNLPFLLDEIAWIKDHRLHQRDAYLMAKRQGRELPLTTPQRDHLWRFFRDYQLGLEARQATDWSGVAMRFWKAVVRDRSIDLPEYDGIFVDEAQFFAPAWFDCVKAALRPGGQLFLCADPTQGFLRRRQSWLASGIDVRGRTVKLDQPYRNSRAILTYATDFYRFRIGEEDGDEELNLPNAERIASCPEVGRPPQVILCGGAQAMTTRLVNEIQALTKRDLRPGTVLILHQSFGALQDLEKRLGNQARILKDTTRKPTQVLAGLSTLNAGTGLEAPIVFVLGIDALFEKEASPTLTDAERRALIRDHTRQLYMAFTRAARQLVILCTRAESESILTASLSAG